MQSLNVIGVSIYLSHLPDLESNHEILSCIEFLSGNQVSSTVNRMAVLSDKLHPLYVYVNRKRRQSSLFLIFVCVNSNSVDLQVYQQGYLK